MAIIDLGYNRSHAHPLLKTGQLPPSFNAHGYILGGEMPRPHIGPSGPHYGARNPNSTPKSVWAKLAGFLI